MLYIDVKEKVEKIEGCLCPGQEEYLFQKVAKLSNSAVIVEIGSYKGRSTAAMAFACVGTNRHIFCIDTWDGNETDFDERQFFDVWKENLSSIGLVSLVTPLRGKSHDILRSWSKTENKQIDFAFIDGSHEFNDVSLDYSLIFPFTKTGGWIAFHDVIHTWPGPQRVWNDIARHSLVNHEQSGTLMCGQKQ